MPSPTRGKQPARRARDPVRITMPAAVAYNPDRLKKSIAELAELIGHPQCFSGADCFFQSERDFAVNPAGKLEAVALNPQPLPPREAGPSPQPWRQTIALGSTVKYDLGRVFVDIDKVIDIIGPHPCISGFDVHFKDVLDTIVINDRMVATQY